MDWLRGLWEKWRGMRMGYRVNALLYVLGGVSLVALVLELAFGGSSATARVRVVSQSPPTTKAAVVTTTTVVPTTTTTLPPTPTTAGRTPTIPAPFIPDPDDALTVDPRNTPRPTDPPAPPVQTTVPVQTTLPTIPPTTAPPATTTTTVVSSAQQQSQEPAPPSQEQGLTVPIEELGLPLL